MDGALALDDVTRTWEFYPNHVVPSSTKTSFALAGLNQLSSEDLQFLKILSCLGMKTTRAILTQARASDNLDAQLASAVDRGLLVPTNDGNETDKEYRFVDEALRDFIYNDIPTEDRPKFHYQIAENLWLYFDLEELDEHIVLVVETHDAGVVLKHADAPIVVA